MMTKRIYLAGPEVFLATARDIGARKRAICERHGLVGVFPGDEEDPCDPALSPAERGLAISRAMERVMRRCDAMIVNLTPFRGPSADVGSAYEMGFMRALGRPLFGYSNDGRSFPDRIASFCGAVRTRTTGEHEDADGMAIEPFALRDNLMLAGGVVASGGCVIVEAAPDTNTTPSRQYSESPAGGAGAFSLSGQPPARCCASSEGHLGIV